MCNCIKLRQSLKTFHDGFFRSELNRGAYYRKLEMEEVQRIGQPASAKGKLIATHVGERSIKNMDGWIQRGVEM